MASLYLDNVSKNVSAENIKNTRWYGYIHDFWDDYDSIDIDGILDIHKHLMVKNNVK